MNKFLFLFVLIFLFKQGLSEIPCDEKDIKPYVPNEIKIIQNVTAKCILFSFDNPSQGNIVLKLAKSNSYTSMIYVYKNKEDILYDSVNKKFNNSELSIHIGEEFFKEKILGNMEKRKYYFIIHENDYFFNDVLTIYNDNFEENNYEINQIENNQINEFDFKYEYTKDNPIIIHFKTPSKNMKYLNYQFLNLIEEGNASLYIYENTLNDDSEIIEKIEEEKEKFNYIQLNKETDYYIKIITNGELKLLLEFLDSLFMIITPDETFQKELFTSNEYFFYIEKDLKQKNDEYFNEFTIKLDPANSKKLPFEIKASPCEGNSQDELIKCVNDQKGKTIIKRDIDIPYIYHIYYSFDGKNYLAIKMSNDQILNKTQRIIIQSSGGIELVDYRHEKVFTNNKGYLYPVYLNISIELVNDEKNLNKTKVLLIYSNTSSAIKIFYNEDTFKNDNMDIEKDEYYSMESYVYGFDFNKKNAKEWFGNRKFFIIMIYCPWESYPISFQLTFINDNIHNFNYTIDERRPLDYPLKINLTSPNEKYYFLGQYNEAETNILFNEVVYGKIEAKYKFINSDDKISRVIFNETAKGYIFSEWTTVHSRIDIIEITCISPALVYMHFIDEQAFHINDITLEKGSQKYIYLNNTNSYDLKLSNNLKDEENVNIEVFIISQRKNQSIDIIINKENYSLNDTNKVLRHSVEKFDSFGIQGKAMATAFRIKIGSGADDKNAYYYEYEHKNSLQNNKLSKQVNINIKNNNNKNAKLCYTSNFFGENYLYIPKEENCFELNQNEKTIISLYNPWSKYLINYNRLYEFKDSYYFIIYVEDDSLKDKIEFSKEELFIEFDSMADVNELVSAKNDQINLIKTSKKENQVLIQFSPKIIDGNNEDKFIIKSQFDQVILDGKIYNKKNRTYAIFNDELIDTFLGVDIQNNNEYEVKYNYITDFDGEKINDDYNIKFVNSSNVSSYIEFKPLLKEKDIDYSVYISLDINNTDLLSISSLKSLKNDNKNIFVLNKDINSKDELIKFNFNSEITGILESNKWILNVLAEAKDFYNLTMSYDLIEGGEIKNNKEEEQKDDNNEENKEEEKKDKEEKEEEKNGISVGKVILLVLLVLVLGVGFGIGAFFFYKKKLKKDEDLLEAINDVNLSMEDQAGRALNPEEGMIK